MTTDTDGRVAGRALGFETSGHACPSCGRGGMRLFYEVPRIPVHSCLMLASRAESLDFPRADLRLGVCEGCGFIANTLFDPHWSAYAENYEDQQSFSPTFNRFARELAQDLVARYDLHGRTVLEIGCSKGDFLTLLCELGPNRGIGIDPSVVVGRVESPATERIEFIREYYSERHAGRSSDLIVCRHTLEHIAPVGEFMRLVRRSIGPGGDTPLFFELPETRRVLSTLAFEDIYYEHCSYFTPGSLARLFRAAGFAVSDLAPAYGDQYLLIHGRPLPEDAPQEAGPLPAYAEPAAQVVQEARQFAARIDAHLARWRERLLRLKAEGRRAVIWGSGSKCVAFLTTLGMTDEVEFVVDINPHRHGRFIPGLGREIMPPEFLREYRPDEVIVMNAIYRDEIARQLAGMGVQARIDAL